MVSIKFGMKMDKKKQLVLTPLKQELGNGHSGMRMEINGKKVVTSKALEMENGLFGRGMVN